MSSSLMLACGVLALIAQTALCAITVQHCAGFSAMKFNIKDVSKYNTYFHENTTMTLAQAGVYQGPDGIAEYVKFALDHSPYVASTKSLASVSVLKSFDAAAGKCRFFSMSSTLYVLHPAFVTAGTKPIQVSVSYSLDYSPATNKIDQLVVYYDVPFIQAWFGALDTKATRTFVCEVMANNCSSTWALNNLKSVSECEAKLANISNLVEGTYKHFDGNTRACRYLHGTFASTNPAGHCPHLSFVPQQDTHGKIKCQTSGGSPPGIGVIDGVDLVNFAGFKVGVKLDPATGYKYVNMTPPSPPASPPASMNNSTNSSDTDMHSTTWTIIVIFVAVLCVGAGILLGRQFFSKQSKPPAMGLTASEKQRKQQAHDDKLAPPDDDKRAPVGLSSHDEITTEMMETKYPPVDGDNDQPEAPPVT